MKQKYTLSLDIGGTKIKAGLIYGAKILNLQNFKTEQKSAQKFLEQIEVIIKNLMNDVVDKIGIATAGLVRKEGDQIDFVPHFPKGLTNIPLKKNLEKKFGLPVKIDNDVHCFILAEHKFGAAKGLTNAIGLTLGTGIGGGLIIDGQLYRGRDNIAGEFGRMIIDASANRLFQICRRSNFEDLAAGPALEKWYKKITNQVKSTYEIAQAAQKNNPPALKALAIQAEYLGVGIANLITIFNPEMTVIGGGISEIKKLWPLLIKETKKNLPYQKLKDCKIVKAKLGANAVLIGASLI